MESGGPTVGYVDVHGRSVHIATIDGIGWEKLRVIYPVCRLALRWLTIMEDCSVGVSPSNMLMDVERIPTPWAWLREFA